MKASQTATGSAVPRSRKFAKSAAREIAYTALAVALIAVCAWISVPLGEVPFTLQTLAIALVGGLFGWKRGLAAVAVYILMGLIGIPVFAGFKSGVPALMGATGGYIIGFVFAVFASGIVKKIPVKVKWARTGIFYGANILGLAICYFFGTLWFIAVFNGGSANPVGVGAALMMCVVPYIVPDLIKLFFAALLSVRLERFVR